MRGSGAKSPGQVLPQSTLTRASAAALLLLLHLAVNVIKRLFIRATTEAAARLSAPEPHLPSFSCVSHSLLHCVCVFVCVCVCVCTTSLLSKVHHTQPCTPPNEFGKQTCRMTCKSGPFTQLIYEIQAKNQDFVIICSFFFIIINFYCCVGLEIVSNCHQHETRKRNQGIKGEIEVWESKNGARRECVMLVRCVSDFPKDPTCHRQSSSGNSCPGGGYVNKQHTHMHTHKQAKGLLKRIKQKTHSHAGAPHRLSTAPSTPPVSLHNQQNTHIWQHTHTHTQMYEDAFIYINHTNTDTFRNAHGRIVHTYHTAHTHTHTHMHS